MNKKGNGLILGIVLLNLLLLIANRFTLQLKEIDLILNRNMSEEILKIKAIQKIENEFLHASYSDFILEEDGQSVEVKFYGTQCHAYFYTLNPFEMILTYDDVFLCIASVEYNYDD
ncbi:MAG: hypothetical protein ACI4U3_09385 [Traorella sp.]